MKIVKYVFLLLLLGSVALTVFIATQDGTYTIEKDKVINVPKTVLFNYINDYNNWQNLGLLNDADTTATYSFSDKTAGEGAAMLWKKDSKTGSVTTLSLKDNDSLSQTVNQNGQESKLVWIFKDTLNNSTAVKVKFSGQRNFKEKAFSLFEGTSISANAGTLEKGLDNLQAFLVTELKNFKTTVGSIVAKNAAFYIGHTQNGSIEAAHTKARENFTSLEAFAKENNLALSGAPFIIYKNINKAENTATYTFAIPIKEEIYTAEGSEFQGGSLLPFNALKVTLQGDYSHLTDAWKKATHYLNQKSLFEYTDKPYVEVYVKGSTQSRRPSQWLTDLYVPAGSTADLITSTLQDATTAPPVKPIQPAAKPSASVQPKTGTSINTKPTTNALGTTKPSQQKSTVSTSSTQVKSAQKTTGDTKPKTTATKTASPKKTTSGDDGLNPPRE